MSHSCTLVFNMQTNTFQQCTIRIDHRAPFLLFSNRRITIIIPSVTMNPTMIFANCHHHVHSMCTYRMFIREDITYIYGCIQYCCKRRSIDVHMKC